MNENELIDLIFNHEYRSYNGKSTNEVLKKLDEIEKLLQYLIKVSGERNYQQKNSLCEQILSSTYLVIEESQSLRLNSKNYFSMKLDNSRTLITFVDTIQLLNMYFSAYTDDEKLENNLPSRLLPLFRFLRRNGLIYFDHTYKKYMMVDYK